MPQMGNEMSPEDRYLDLLKRALTRYSFPEERRPLRPTKGSARRVLYTPVRALLARFGLELTKIEAYEPKHREVGLDWPADADTMVGLARLSNVEDCVKRVVREGVPGDLMETGVWRGGVCILMRAILEVLGDRERDVWLADSFRGLPKPADPQANPDDVADRLWQWDFLAVSVDEVRERFLRYGLLDDRVRFLEGMFEDTLPTAPMRELALLRLDGDMYESTMVALESLYPKLSVGGFVIVDDYGSIRGCRRAVEEFRDRNGITDPLEQVDWTGMFWRRSG